MRGLLLTPEERDTPAILTQAAAITRTLPQPVMGRDSLLRLATDDQAREQHISMLSTLPDDQPRALRLARITAEAKITHATSHTGALDDLERSEVDALVMDPALLTRWSSLSA
jgi:membrane glycosyltransferase